MSRQCKDPNEMRSEYVSVLCKYREAVLAEKIFDVYGYGQTMPEAQGAAIDAFCLVVNDPPDDLEDETHNDPTYFANRITSAAQSSDEFGSPASLRKAVKRLEAILGVESFNEDLIEHYAKACYE